MNTATLNTADLAAAIERDLLRTEPARTNAPECFACGRSFLPRPSDGEDTSRFCSGRCREAYDAGLPPNDPDQSKKLANRFNPGALRVVAGPPGLSSYDPLQGSRQLSGGIKRRGASGFVIACLGCGPHGQPFWQALKMATIRPNPRFIQGIPVKPGS